MATRNRRDLDDDSLNIFVLPEGEEVPTSDSPPLPLRPGGRRLSPLRSLRHHPGLAVLGVAAVVLAAIPLLLVLRRPVYAAEATVLVSQVFAKNLSEDREFQLPRFHEFVKQQLVLIEREEIAMDALEGLGDRRSLWMQPGESRRDGAVRLAARISARQLPDTSYILVRLEGPSPEGLAEVVNAVVDAYLARSRGQPFYGLDLRREALNRHKAQLVDDIRAKTELLARWAKEQGVAGFDTKPREGPLEEAEKALQTARGRLLDAEARLAAFEARHALLLKTDLSVEGRELLNSDVELVGLKSVLLAKKNEYKARLTGLTPEHEGRKALERRMAEIDGEIAKAEETALHRITGLLRQRRDARLQDERQTLALDVEQARRAEKTLGEEAVAAAARVTRFNDVYYAAQNVVQEVDRLRRQLAAVEDRLDMMRLESYAPGFIHLVAAALPPTAPMPVKYAKWLALVAAAALAFGASLPLIRDALDNRVRVPSDLAPELEGTALSGIPEREPGTEKFMLDQLRRLALRLDRDRRQRNRRKVVFTGVKAGAGTTQLVLELTRELRNLGVHALAVEVNPIHADPRYAGTPGPGLLEALAGSAPLDQTVRPGESGLPLRVPLGDTRGRALLAGVDRLPAALDQLLTQHQILLLDGPPVLRSSDAEMLVGMADSVVLLVGASTSFGDVRRAYRILQQVGTPVPHTVVNRVRISGAGRTREYAELMKEHDVAARAPTA